MTTATAPDFDPMNPTQHPYVAPTVTRWRTCQVCGFGANSSLHKAEPVEAPKPAECPCCLRSFKGAAGVASHLAKSVRCRHFVYSRSL